MAASLYYSILIIIILFEVNCQIAIPLKYYPEKKYNNSNQGRIMDNILKQRAYSEIYIGTPKAEIQIPLDFQDNIFFISDNPTYINASEKFSDVKYYHSKDSNTYKDVEEYMGEFLTIDANVLAYYKQDSFYFNNIEKTLPFFEPLNNYKDLVGAIGMKLNPFSTFYDGPFRNRSFFEIMKKYYNIKTYDWTIFYESDKNDKIEERAYLLLGCLPHEFDKKEYFGHYKEYNFNEKDIKEVNIHSPKSTEFYFRVDNLIAYYGKNQNDLINGFDGSSYLTLELNYDIGGILIPYNFLKYYKDAFSSFIQSNKCFENKTEGWNEIFFYCNKEIKDDINLKQKIPGMIFKSVDLDYNFTLDEDDLFYERGDYVYFLGYFLESQKYTWKMGKPFLRKYPFSINYDKNIITFYSIKNENIQDNSGIPTYILIISIIATAIIFGLVFFFVFKFCLYEKYFRKKRANELTDDDFEYTSKDDENKNNEKNKLGINDNE